MKHTLLFSLVASILAVSAATAEAKSKDNHHHKDDDRRVSYERDHQRTRTIYVVERNRPVQRVVYVTSDGRYYRSVSGRRVYVSGRYYTSYPTQYYYRDGRPRVGVSVTF